MEELWSSLHHEDISSPEWHRDVLDARRRSVESGESELISLDELRGRLSSKRG